MPGQPVDMYNASHPDWIPTLNLGRNGGKKVRPDTYQCAMQRHAKKELQSKGQKDVAELVDCEASTSSMELGVTASSSSEDKGTQTDFTSENIDQLESVVNHCTVENENWKQKVKEKRTVQWLFFEQSWQSYTLAW